MTSGPDFICIGAPKSGTTWLYRNLNAHPSIWLPPVKELHYFDKLFPIPSFSSKKYDPKGLFGLFNLYSRKKIIRSFFKAVRRASIKDVWWNYRYFSGNPSDDWYLSLFSGKSRLVTGDLTTDYCALSEDAVSHVKDLVPNTKVIFLMRNPVDRAWSHAKMLLPELLGKPVTQIDTAEYIEYISHSAPRLRGNYRRTVNIWEKKFGEDQIFYGFFDEITDSPRAVYLRLLQFLDVSCGDDVIPDDLEKKVNVSNAPMAYNMPEVVRAHLSDLYQADLEWLADKFGGCASNWRDCDV